MKTLYRLFILLALSMISISNIFSQDTLFIVKSVAIDWDKDGDIDGMEIQFNQTIDFSQSDDENDDWSISNYYDMSNSVVASDVKTDVKYIADANVADDEYMRIEFTNNPGGLLADDNSTPIYFLYTQTNAPADAVVSLDHSDTLATMVSSLITDDYSPPVIDSYNITEIGGTTLEIDDTIKFEINLLTPELGIIITPYEYNGRNLNWSTSDNQTFLGTYAVTEGDPDQISDLDFTNVGAEDINGNKSDLVTFNVTKGIDANRPDISTIFYSPGDGNILGIDSVLTITMLAENSETGLSIDSALVNGIDVSGSFAESGSGLYTVQYTVQSGHGSIDDATEAIPVILILDDGIYLTSPIFEDSTIFSSPGIDDSAPSISTVTLSPSIGTLGIGDTIKFTITALEDGLNASVISINGKNLINEFIAIGSNQYEVEYVIESGDTNIPDASDIPISIILSDNAGNPSNNFNSLIAGNCPGIDANRPNISNVTFSPVSGNVSAVGETIDITITASESNLSADSISVNGKSFAIAGVVSPYTISYTIVNGDNDVADTAPIPIYFTLTDGTNVSLPFTTADIAAGDCPGIDANRPDIVSVSFSPGDGKTLGIDSVLTVTLEAENLETGLTESTMTVNGVSGTFNEVGLGIYTVEYTVLNGHGSIDDATQAIPINFVLNDGENLTLPAYTNSTIASTPGIDDTAPSISSVTLLPNSGMQGIGDTIIFTVTAGEDGLEASSISINGNDLINKFIGIGTNQYQIEYVIAAGDDYISDATDIPISIILNDAAGNVSNDFNSLAAGNCPGIDGGRPSITSVTVNPVAMLYNQTYTITIEVNTDAIDTWSLVSGTLAGFNLFNLSKFDNNTYEADFTVGALGYDILDGDSYNVLNLKLSDPAGNISDTYSTTINQAGDPIYTVLPSAKVTGKYNVCDGDSAELVIQLTGSAPWDIDLFDGTGTTVVNGITESPFMYKVEANDVNGLIEPDTVIYKITEVVDFNGNIVTISTVNDSAMVFAYEIPIVDITDPPGNKTFNVNADQDTLVGNPVGGVFSGNGIVPSNNTFLASAAGIGTHDIVYIYTIPSSGCYDSDTVEFEVISSNADITFDNDDDDWRCEYEVTMGVTAEVITDPLIIGTLSLSPNPGAISSTGNNAADIDIQQLSAGTYEVTFDYFDGGSISVTKSFTVDSVSSALNFNNILDQCEDYDTIKVNTINLIPSGGTGAYTFSGAGGAFEYVSGSNNNSGYLLPEQISPGSYTLEYVYTTPNGCQSDPVIKYFDINGLPTVSLTMNSVYNIDQGETTITGTPADAGGEFWPAFMDDNLDGTAQFDPLDAGIGTWWVKYTYTDANTCVNVDSTQIEVNEALGEITSLSGSFMFCNNGSIEVFTGTPNPTDGSAGSFYIDNVPITPESDNTILFNPQNYLAGDHTVKFEYNNGATVYEVYKTINIDSIGDIYFTGLDSKYCEDEDDEFELTASPPTGGVGAMYFSGNGITDDVVDNLAYFNPYEANLGDHLITYTFTREYSGCQKSYSNTTTVNKTPRIDSIRPNDKCVVSSEDQIGFTAYTYASDSIENWDWEFRSIFTSTDQTPQFTPIIGKNRTQLTVVTKDGCSFEVDTTFYIGTRVDLAFTYENECHGETVLFKLLESSDTDDTLSVNWEFGGEGIADLSNSAAPTYKYSNPGAYEVIYEEFLKSCGRIADTVKINIRPSIDLSTGYYEQEFEDNSDVTGWVIEDFVEGVNNSWEWGKPAGVFINKAASGSNAFVTNLTGDYDINEQGMVTSPCFDFSNLKRPMIKMDVTYITDESDGAVIQYTKPNGDWAAIGIPNEGIEWYESVNVGAEPASQSFGWTSENYVDWHKAMYRLDELSGRAGVRFRVVFGTNGDSNTEGFGFDNIWIGERTRTVLLENFTNINNDVQNPLEVAVNSILLQDSLDVINLNYHASFPDVNDFNSFYPSGPSARSLFYGVSGVPYSLVDGGQRSYDYSQTNKLTESDVHKRMLIDPLFDISVKQENQNGNFVISSTVKAFEPIVDTNIIVYVALVENPVDGYNNVLRTMLPDAAGILIDKDWLEGDSVKIIQSWNIPEGVNAESLITIVFVQDEDTKEIYQTAFTDIFSTITSIDENFENILDVEYVVYPNPTDDILNVKLYKSLTYDLEINIYNNIGALVKSEKLNEGNIQKEINTNDLPIGIYYLNLGNTDKLFGTKKIIKTN